MGGCNNKSTVGQFAATYKNLMLRNSMLIITNGNCLPLKSVPVLNVCSQCNDSVTQHSVKIINTSLVESGLRDETTKVPADNTKESY